MGGLRITFEIRCVPGDCFVAVLLAMTKRDARTKLRVEEILRWRSE
jgi:hypothetical protein